MHIEEVSLKHTLTDSELAGLARTQSNALGKKAAAEAELAAIKKDFGGRIALAQAEVTNCSQAVNTGWEMRNIRCIMVDERPVGYRLVVRADNGHVAKRRKLKDEERQMRLSEDGAPEYVASALLLVDDMEWETEVCQVPLRQDEFELLQKALPPITFGPPPARGTRQIEAPVEGIQGDGFTLNKPEATEKRGRGRPKKNK